MPESAARAINEAFSNANRGPSILGSIADIQAIGLEREKLELNRDIFELDKKRLAEQTRQFNINANLAGQDIAFKEIEFGTKVLTNDAIPDEVAIPIVETLFRNFTGQSITLDPKNRNLMTRRALQIVEGVQTLGPTSELVTQSLQRFKAEFGSTEQGGKAVENLEDIVQSAMLTDAGISPEEQAILNAPGVDLNTFKLLRLNQAKRILHDRGLNPMTAEEFQQNERNIELLTSKFNPNFSVLSPADRQADVEAQRTIDRNRKEANTYETGIALLDQVTSRADPNTVFTENVVKRFDEDEIIRSNQALLPDLPPEARERVRQRITSRQNEILRELGIGPVEARKQSEEIDRIIMPFIQETVQELNSKRRAKVSTGESTADIDFQLETLNTASNYYQALSGAYQTIIFNSSPHESIRNFRLAAAHLETLNNTKDAFLARMKELDVATEEARKVRQDIFIRSHLPAGTSDLDAARIRKLDAEVAAIETRKAQTEASTEFLKLKSRELGVTLETLSDQKLNELALLKERISTLQAKKDLVPAEQAALEALTNERKARVQEFQTRLPEVTRRVTLGEQRRDALQREIDNLQNTLTTAPADQQASLTTRIATLQDQLDSTVAILKADTALRDALSDPTGTKVQKAKAEISALQAKAELDLKRAQQLGSQADSLKQARERAINTKTSIEAEKFEAESFAATVGLEALRQGIDVNDDKALGQFLVNKVDEARQAGRTLFTPPTLEQVKSAIGLAKPDSTREQVFQSQVTVDGETKKVTLRRDPESPTGFSIVEVPGLGPAIGEPTPLISFGTQERKELREIDNLIGQLQEIDRLFDPSVVGPLDSLKTKALSSLDLLTPQQREFLAQLRELEGERISEKFGATLPPQEIELARKFIPNENMQDNELKAAIRITIKNLQRARGILESQGGRGKLGKPGSPAKTAEERFNELTKSGLSKEEAFRELIKEGF